MDGLMRKKGGGEVQGQPKRASEEFQKQTQIHGVFKMIVG